MRAALRIIKLLIALAVLFVAGLGMYIYLGDYPIGADVPHSGLVFWLLATMRDRGVATQTRNIRVPPDLDNPRRLSYGAG